MSAKKTVFHAQKKPTVHRNVRLPQDIHDEIQREADRLYNGNFTAAFTAFLGRALEYWHTDEEERRRARNLPEKIDKRE